MKWIPGFKSRNTQIPIFDATELWRTIISIPTPCTVRYDKREKFIVFTQSYILYKHNQFTSLCKSIFCQIYGEFVYSSFTTQCSSEISTIQCYLILDSIGSEQYHCTYISLHSFIIHSSRSFLLFYLFFLFQSFFNFPFCDFFFL